MSPIRAFLFPAALASALTLTTAGASAEPSHLGLHRVRVTNDAAFAVGARGKPVRLTLDPDLQRTAERLLASADAPEAAIVASDVRTGRILVWASRGDRDYVAEPHAPSASLFKIVTAAALLDGGHANEGTRACWSGGDHDIKPADLEGRGSACTTFGEALGKSINVVFARLAKDNLEASDLRRMAENVGFAGDLPIDVPARAGRVEIPDDPFGMARAAAGFWNGKLSPLGALFAMQTIANGGERVRLVLRDPGVPVARVVERRALDPRVARTLTRMLEVTTRRGTCVRAFRRADGTRALPGISVAAKTGTLVGKRPARMFSWFAGFAPTNKPEIAVSVMLANDLTWRTKANVVGRQLLEAYFADRAR
ncbi:penicillin-binding transpeptidase domain-containing protein [Polyangium aurulentum]|uniref:penicillin-binding transpeptidase domain-containing protein n=1 Tax=Polyangium aurulentum TaxID=2567896 RepID=UPI001F370138|nr:penicillin-binding transpeptidase domain-containing protein [Polyangium aurulentum]